MLPKPGGTSFFSSERLPIIGQPVPIIAYLKGNPCHKEALPVTAGLTVPFQNGKSNESHTFLFIADTAVPCSRIHPLPDRFAGVQNTYARCPAFQSVPFRYQSA